MTDIRDNSLLRAAERVRAIRAAERVEKVERGEILEPIKTSASVRAALNHIPDDSTLRHKIGDALTALARGIRWARGSILNLLV